MSERYAGRVVVPDHPVGFDVTIELGGRLTVRCPCGHEVIDQHCPEGHCVDAEAEAVEIGLLRSRTPQPRPALALRTLVEESNSGRLQDPAFVLSHLHFQRAGSMTAVDVSRPHAVTADGTVKAIMQLFLDQGWRGGNRPEDQGATWEVLVLADPSEPYFVGWHDFDLRPGTLRRLAASGVHEVIGHPNCPDDLIPSLFEKISPEKMVFANKVNKGAPQRLGAHPNRIIFDERWTPENRWAFDELGWQPEVMVIGSLQHDVAAAVSFLCLAIDTVLERENRDRHIELRERDARDKTELSRSNGDRLSHSSGITYTAHHPELNDNNWSQLDSMLDRLIEPPAVDLPILLGFILTPEIPQPAADRLINIVDSTATHELAALRAERISHGGSLDYDFDSQNPHLITGWANLLATFTTAARREMLRLLSAPVSERFRKENRYSGLRGVWVGHLVDLATALAYLPDCARGTVDALTQWADKVAFFGWRVAENQSHMLRFGTAVISPYTLDHLRVALGLPIPVDRMPAAHPPVAPNLHRLIDPTRVHQVLRGGMPPAFRKALVPNADDMPTSAAASSLDSPRAIASQNPT
jgi:hypothetical protein